MKRNFLQNFRMLYVAESCLCSHFMVESFKLEVLKWFSLCITSLLCCFVFSYSKQMKLFLSFQPKYYYRCIKK
jgi:hypothetical protein